MSKTALVENESYVAHAEPVTSPDYLIQLAIEKNADVDKLEKLFELKERWEATEARKAYNAAIAKFRAECPPIKKTKQAHNSKYAGLSETLEQIKPHLEACGLSHSWHTDQSGGSIAVTCKVTHIMGHSDETALSAEPDTSGSKNSIQSIGSTVTYLQRYTLSSVLGLASTDEFDDDGASSEQLDAEAVTSLFESANTLAELDARTGPASKLQGEDRKKATEVYRKRKEELSNAK